MIKRVFLKKRRSRVAYTLPALTLTPLIDTVLVLLIVFMVTSTGNKTSEQPVAQPVQEIQEKAPVIQALQADTKPDNKPETKIETKDAVQSSLLVRVTPKGVVFINQARVTRKDFKISLARALKKLSNPLKIVVLKVEPGAPLALVQEIKRIVHQAEGIHGVYEAK